MSSSQQYSSEGFDVDAMAAGDDDVVLELGGGATVIPKEPENPKPTNDDTTKQQQQQDEDPAEIAESQQFKARGNDWFQQGNYLEAYDCYTDAIVHCPGPYDGKELIEKQELHLERERYKANEEFRKRDLSPKRFEMHERAKRDTAAARAAVGMTDEEVEKQETAHTPATDSSVDENNNDDKPRKPEPFVVPSHPYAKELAVYHCNRAASCMHLQRLKDAKEDCNIAILLQPTYVKALVRRCNVHEQLEEYDEALQDAYAINKLDPTKLNRNTIPRLQKLRDEQLEKLKTETMGQLKELGNSILGNFGLSLDNFNAVQDPNTGSYSISFNQNNDSSNSS